MSDVLQKPAVIDVEAMLHPISEESPSGESLRYSGIYDEINEARRADDNLNQGAWTTELKVADYRQVINLAVPAITSQSKDLQIAAWLSESLIKIHGFTGLRDSIQLLTGLQDRFWDTLHPEVDEGDMEGRANAIAWFESQGAFAVKAIPFTGGDGYSLIDWEDSKTFDFPENMEMLETAEQIRLNELKAQAEAQRRVTGDLWRKAVAATRRAEMESVNFAVDECWAAIKELNTVIEARYDRNQMPGLTGFRKALDDVHTQVKKLLEEKRAEEPDEVEADETGEAGVNEDGTVRAAGVANGAISTRKDALKRLNDIADFFQKTEPHSPISYIVQRAVKWGNMPLESWLQDVIKDETVLFNLRQTLGFNTNSNDNQQGQ
ncbi:MAG: type VI secretion system protein TssA [Pyrinomonadaceae bacterium]